MSTPTHGGAHGQLPGQQGPRGEAHLVVEGRDEPQLRLQAGAALLGGNKLQQVLMLHARRAEDLPLTLPRLLVLKRGAQLNPTAATPPGSFPPAPDLSLSRQSRTAPGQGPQASGEP